MDSKDEKFLLGLGQKMNTQDNRATQFPLFVVQETVKVPVLWGDDYDIAERKEEVRSDSLCTDCLKIYENDGELPEHCEDCDNEAFDFYKEEDQFNLMAGVFLTSKACDDHIALNAYHYRRPRSYGIAAWRNPEMENLMRILSKNARPDGKPKDYYN